MARIDMTQDLIGYDGEVCQYREEKGEPLKELTLLDACTQALTATYSDETGRMARGEKNKRGKLVRKIHKKKSRVWFKPKEILMLKALTEKMWPPAIVEPIWSALVPRPPDEPDDDDDDDDDDEPPPE